MVSRLHTQITGAFELKDENYNVVNILPLREIYHLPGKLLINGTYDELLRGQVSQSVQEYNNKYTEEVTEWLFANENFGLDIVSLNVQRGTLTRHGLAEKTSCGGFRASSMLFLTK